MASRTPHSESIATAVGTVLVAAVVLHSSDISLPRRFVMWGLVTTIGLSYWSLADWLESRLLRLPAFSRLGSGIRIASIVAMRGPLLILAIYLALFVLREVGDR